MNKSIPGSKAGALEGKGAQGNHGKFAPDFGCGAPVP